MADDEQSTVITIPVMAQLLMLSRQRIDQLVRDGWMERHSVGKMKLVDGVQGYIRFLRDEHKRMNVRAANSRVGDARAREIEIRTAERLARLVPVEIYDEMIDKFAGLVRSEFAGLSAASTRDLTMRRIIEREVNDRLRRIAEHALAQARLVETGGADHAVRDNGAGHLGGDKPNVPANRRRSRPS